MIYLDNAATTRQKPPQVIDAVVNAMTTMGNASRGAHGSALQAAQLLGWKVISCVDPSGQLRSIQDIHEEVWALAAPLL